MNPKQLTVVKGGIDRLRTKGAALQDSLYDLLNGYVTERKTVVVRPGTFRDTALPAGTKGLTYFDGNLVVFAAQTVAVPAGYKLYVITHPLAGATPIAINKIYFAEPFMGFLYVVANFVGYISDYYHFWLQEGAVWQANHTYKFGDIVAPSTPNGFAYQASRLGSANLKWAAGVQRALNDVIEPTEYNDFYYTAVSVQGTNPRSGSVEPEWPTEAGAQITEDADGLGTAGSSDSTSAPNNADTPNPDTNDRYDIDDPSTGLL